MSDSRTLTSNPLGDLLPKLRSTVAAMERLSYADGVGVLRAGLDWSVSESGQRRSLTAGDIRNLLIEVEALQRNLDLRNEQIDGYERQLGIDKAGAEHTIGSEIERLLRNKPHGNETNDCHIRPHDFCSAGTCKVCIDAARYRHLRLSRLLPDVLGHELDAAIDEAMRRAAQKANAAPGEGCGCSMPYYKICNPENGNPQA